MAGGRVQIIEVKQALEAIGSTASLIRLMTG